MSTVSRNMKWSTRFLSLITVSSWITVHLFQVRNINILFALLFSTVKNIFIVYTKTVLCINSCDGFLCEKIKCYWELWIYCNIAGFVHTLDTLVSWYLLPIKATNRASKTRHIKPASIIIHIYIRISARHRRSAYNDKIYVVRSVVHFSHNAYLCPFQVQHHGTMDNLM